MCGKYEGLVQILRRQIESLITSPVNEIILGIPYF